MAFCRTKRTQSRKDTQDTAYMTDSKDRRTISSGILTEKQDSQKGHTGQSIGRTVRTVSSGK
jgi:hypothetical protein